MSKIAEQCICLHKSKYLYDDQGKLNGFEYCEEQSEADIVAVYLQQHYEDEKGIVCSEFDVLEEKDFDIKEYGSFNKAYEQAQNYVEELEKKYSNAGYDEY
tara:strand:- start:623 stop:925 length:303 start_codon:yes stop_codon:yes gene_type:complete